MYEIKKGECGDHPPLIRNIIIENMISEKSKYAMYFQGIKQETVINGIQIENCTFNGVERGNFIEYSEKPVLKEVYINKKLVEL